MTDILALTTDKTICEEPKMGARILCEVPAGGFTAPDDTMRLYEVRRGDFIRVRDRFDSGAAWVAYDWFTKHKDRYTVVLNEWDGKEDRAIWLTTENLGFIAIHRTWKDVEWFILEGMRARIDEVEVW